MRYHTSKQPSTNSIVIYAGIMLLSCMTLLNPGNAHAVEKIGHFTMVSGNVDDIREEHDAPIAAELGMDTYLQDIVRTKHRSRTQLKLIDNSVLNMGANYKLKIKEYVYDEENGIRKAILQSLRGTVRLTVAKMGGNADSLFEVHTPTAIASVRGTDFIVKVNSSMETEVIVLEGAVAVRNINPMIKGEVVVLPGKSTKVKKDSLPSSPVAIPIEMVEVLVEETTPPPGSSLPKAKSTNAQTGKNNKSQPTSGKGTTSTQPNKGEAGGQPATQTPGTKAPKGNKPTAQVPGGNAGGNQQPATKATNASPTGQPTSTGLAPGAQLLNTPAPLVMETPAVPLAPPPPPPVPLAKPRLLPPVYATPGNPGAKALPPVQPPVTGIAQTIITAPVAITLVF